LKPIDRHFAKTSTSLVANSTFTQAAIERFWGLKSEVINPPISAKAIGKSVVDASNLSSDEFQILESLPDEFVLGASRFVEYKELEKVLEVALWGNLPAVIAGAGPLEKFLRHSAQEMGVKAIFVIRPSDQLLYQMYKKALVYVFPALEDFGIMPLEANAAGTPTFVRSIGGTLDSLEDGVNGFSVDFASKTDVKRALGELTKISRTACSGHAMRFDDVVFIEKIKTWVEA
jgi:glycosyltransferase involved in cell wall biosynthesis